MGSLTKVHRSHYPSDTPSPVEPLLPVSMEGTRIYANKIILISLEYQPMAITVSHTHCGQHTLKMEALRSSIQCCSPTPLRGALTQLTAARLAPV
jgi:hypothetical protein